MTPDEKRLLDIDNALDFLYARLTPWEINFLKTIKQALLSSYKHPSLKQKELARGIVKKLKS